MAKKTRKDYKYYNLSVPEDIRIFYEKYLELNPNLPYNLVSQVLLNIIKEKMRKLAKKHPELRQLYEKLKSYLD